MKVWQGPTPYDEAIAEDPTERGNYDRSFGFTTAMNSPEVLAMYGWLRLYVNFLDGGGEVPDTLQAMGVLASYEAGLQENDDDNQSA